MAVIDRNNTDLPITEDNTYTFDAVPENEYLVKIKFTTGAGDITILDAQGDAYRNDDDTADLMVDEASNVTSYLVEATGRKIQLLAENFVSGSADISVINKGRT